MDRPQVEITLFELVQALQHRKGANIVTLHARCDLELNKTVPTEDGKRAPNPYFGRVETDQTVTGVVNFNYQNSVNNQLEREGKTADFVAQPRQWGVRVKGAPFVAHKGQLYLSLKVQQYSDYQYLVDGNPVTKEEIEPYLKPKSSSSRQGTDKEILERDFKLHNVLDVKMNKVHYLVRHDSINLELEDGTTIEVRG